jgi:hypothetical protein
VGGFVPPACCLHPDLRVSSWKERSRTCHGQVHFPCTERTADTRRTDGVYVCGTAVRMILVVLAGRFRRTVRPFFLRVVRA